VKVSQPLHLTPDWIGRDLSRTLQEGGSGRTARRTIYIRPKTISIRQYIERAEKLKNI
jgi:hypothetical protein